LPLAHSGIVSVWHQAIRFVGRVENPPIFDVVCGRRNGQYQCTVGVRLGDVFNRFSEAPVGHGHMPGI
jgi:hypothetical protein